MTEAKTIEAVRELYSSKLRNSLNSEQIQKNSIGAKQGENTFICNVKRQTRLS